MPSKSLTVGKPTPLAQEIEKAHVAIEANKRACEAVKKARCELGDALKKKTPKR